MANNIIPIKFGDMEFTSLEIVNIHNIEHHYNFPSGVPDSILSKIERIEVVGSGNWLTVTGVGKGKEAGGVVPNTIAQFRLILPAKDFTMSFTREEEEKEKDL